MFKTCVLSVSYCYSVCIFSLFVYECGSSRSMDQGVIIGWDTEIVSAGGVKVGREC